MVMKAALVDAEVMYNNAPYQLMEDPEQVETDGSERWEFKSSLGSIVRTFIVIPYSECVAYF